MAATVTMAASYTTPEGTTGTGLNYGAGAGGSSTSLYTRTSPSQ